ncbi:MAG: Sec-independent protein translocase TatA [Rhizobiales bacterium 65-9]|mgnify:CR=1 FL=1|nr:twin-arginine translocase TatA/TatE family subunit [Hyphomicrobiales bacterium]OJY37645.1 MAG: Sec-independent protein translocase TatA [Rhizobiales bacterium 65-9]
MGGASIWHWVVVGVVVMLLFGRGKLSELMGDAAKGIKAFKKGMADDEAQASADAAAAAAAAGSGKTIDHTAPQPASQSTASKVS